jgi:hypothetical protein
MNAGPVNVKLGRRQLLVSGIAAMAAGCGVLTPSYAFNFRLSLHLVVDGVAKTASTVIRAVWADTLGMSDLGGRWSGHFDGDAIAIKPGAGEFLLALLGNMETHPTGCQLILGQILSFLPGPISRTDERKNFEQLQNLNGEHNFPTSNWPILMYFQDVNSPETATFVSPDDLSGVFGVQAQVTRFTLALTDEGPSSRLKHDLPWFGEVGKFGLAHPTLSPQTLSPFDQLHGNNLHANGARI